MLDRGAGAGVGGLSLKGRGRPGEGEVGSSGGHPGPGQGGALSAHLPTLPAIQILALFKAPLEGGSWGVREATPPGEAAAGRYDPETHHPCTLPRTLPRSQASILRIGGWNESSPSAAEKANVTQPAACTWLPREAPRSQSADRGSGRPAGPSPNRYWGESPPRGVPGPSSTWTCRPIYRRAGRPGQGSPRFATPGKDRTPPPPTPPDDPAQGSRQHQHQSPQMLEKRRLVRSARTLRTLRTQNLPAGSHTNRTGARGHGTPPVSSVSDPPRVK